MSTTYLTVGAVYVAVTLLCIWGIARDAHCRADMKFYRPEPFRGGYVDQDGVWVLKKNLWRACCWYCLVVAMALLSPLILLYLLVWEGLLGRLFGWEGAPVVPQLDTPAFLKGRGDPG